MIKVEGHSNLYRDEESGAIMNLDSAGYQEYVKKRNAKIREKEEISSLKSEISEIKLMLQQILKDKN